MTVTRKALRETSHVTVKQDNVDVCQMSQVGVVTSAPPTTGISPVGGDVRCVAAILGILTVPSVIRSPGNVCAERALVANSVLSAQTGCMEPYSPDVENAIVTCKGHLKMVVIKQLGNACADQDLWENGVTPAKEATLIHSPTAGPATHASSFMIMSSELWAHKCKLSRTLLLDK